MKKFITLKLNPSEAEVILKGLDYSYNEDYGNDDEINKEIISIKEKLLKEIKKVIEK